MPHLCLIEDDLIMGESLSDRFQLEGFTLDWHRDGRSAAGALRRQQYAAVISDVRLSDISGEDLFLHLRNEATPLPPFLFITAYAAVDRAVEMLKLGAFDYVTKPFDITELVGKVRSAVGSLEPASARIGAGEKTGVLGISSSMRSLEQQSPRVAARARTVLITGESGSGKEVLARHIHHLAFPAGEAPFVAVNCGAIPESLIEAALFGHERGAYTGADRMRRGHLEQANGGTLFLDEVAELPPPLQVRLLRVLQERQVQRLGSEATIEVDFRLVCATHRNLQALVEAGSFREDLYYRIHVVNLRVPPLRERPDDILWLAQEFLSRQASSMREEPRSLSPGARAALLAYTWPGNVRELQNRIERACVMATQSVLAASDLFDERNVVEQVIASSGSQLPTLDMFMADAERAYLQAVLQRCEGRVGQAAAMLGISRKTLWEKSRRHGLSSIDPP
jgi:DNA-binding NtrC family response regulator